MSGTVRRVRTDGASLTAIRGLLERNLTDRAIALAETRWPGSGPLVELAHEWAVLSPVARRERLAAIGPEDLARLRGVAELQPDLARVLEDLEKRGILPPEQAQADTGADPSQTLAPPATAVPSQPAFEAAIENVAVDANEAVPDRPIASQLDAAAEAVSGATTAAAAATAAAEAAAFAADAAAEASRLRAEVGPVPPVAMPDLDLGLPSAADFLAQEAEQRLKAAEAAAAILDRARSHVDTQTEKLLPRPEVSRQQATPNPDVIVPPPPIVEQSPPPAGAKTISKAPSTRVDSPLDTLRRQIDRERVVVFERDEARPSTGDLQMIANDLLLDYVALDADALGKQAFYGGLVREGRAVEPRAGAFPRAVNRPAFVAVWGRIYPKAVERLLAGYCDIPGTQATVRLHPDCRIVIMPG